MRKLIFERIMGVACLLLLTLSLFTLAGAASAQGLVVPEVDLFAQLADLLLNWKVLPGLTKGMFIILILTQILKQVKDFEYKRLLTVILSIGYGVVMMMIEGSSLGSSAVMVLVSGGGAMLLYDVLKPFLSKISFLDFLDLGKK